jgi:hypothetical protein
MFGKNQTKLDPKNNICVVKTDVNGNKEWFYGSNIVTNDGDIYYAKKGAGDTPASNENFGRTKASCILQNPSSADTPAKADDYGEVTSPIVTSGAEKLVSSNYPKSNDQDADNTGKGADVITYKFEWTTAQINTASGNPITGGCILDTDATPADGVKILTHWNFATPASFHKTSTDTLTLYVNHTMNGV